MQVYKKRIWIIGFLAVSILLFHALAGQRTVMNAIVGITLPLRQWLGWLCGLVPFSVAELLACLGVAALPVWLVWTLLSFRRAKEKRRILLWRRVSLLLVVLLTLYLLLCLLLGASYRADGFQERSGLYARPSSIEALYQTTARFVEKLWETAPEVPRGADGCFAASLDEMFAPAAELYRGAEAQYAFLTMADRTPKRAFFSRLMSRFNYTGFYFPYTGEANINVDVVPCMIPATIAHEMAHQRGIASEQEANFVAVLACAKSGDPLYTYSGWLFGYLHLCNALYRSDPDAYFQLAEQLPTGAKADLQANNAYWAQFETPEAKVSEAIYDTMLKSYGQPLGVQSYGAVVDLLIAWEQSGGLTA